jgi:AraC-like DNA-binding protein
LHDPAKFAAFVRAPVARGAGLRCNAAMTSLDELRALIARHGRAPGEPGALPGLRVTAATRPTPVEHHVCEPGLGLVAQGAKQTLLGDETFDYETGHYIVTTIDLPISSRIVRASPAAPYLSVGLVLQPAAIAALLLETAVAERETAGPDGLGVNVASADLLDAVVRLVRLLERPADVAVLRPLVEREILWRLLSGPDGARVRLAGLADSRLSQVAHAIRWIRAHYPEPLAVEQLAGLAAMSVSSFHRHFRAVTAMSPLAYQKQIRLQEARRRLIVAPVDAARVAYAVGYESPSQFSREYARLFGLPPIRDATRLRGDGAMIEA